MADKHTGLSNRETPEQEDREREAHPPVLPDRPPESSTDEPDVPDVRDVQGPTKSGARSGGQKSDGSKYVERTAPQVDKKSGAFGKE